VGIYDPVMSRLGRSLGTVALGVAVTLVFAGPSYAGGFQDCLDKAVDHNGEPPTCTKVNGQWVASWPDDNVSSGIPGGFVFFGVIVVVLGLALFFWKVSTAQKLARQSGMDPGLATQMTVLTDDGLEATYLASSLRGARTEPQTPATPSASPSASATSRLEELKRLLDGGLVTQAEYDERRKAIIDSL
jgi:hypothetical protein